VSTATITTPEQAREYIAREYRRLGGRLEQRIEALTGSRRAGVDPVLGVALDGAPGDGWLCGPSLVDLALTLQRTAAREP
jgi:hypothetical protein